VKRNILLIAPFKGPIGIKDMFAAPCFGLYRIKCYIEEKFPETRVDVIDPNIEKVDFNSKSYDFIGFSLTHTTLEYDLGLVHRAKKEAPGSILMAGGIEATFIADWLIKTTPMDFVVLGEGEEVLENILCCYNSSSGLKSIMNVAGVVIRNKQDRALARSLDQNRFSYISSLVDFSKIPYKMFWRANARQYREPDSCVINAIRMFTGNYCPHNCTFCSSTNFLDYAYSGDYGRIKKTKVVSLKPEQILNMILRALEAHPQTKTIILDDDNFAMSTKRLLKACDLILDAKAQKRVPEELTFICQARIDNFRSSASSGLLALMKKAGFRMIMYGVESFSENVLAEFGKKTDIALISNILRATTELGIKPLIYLILFSPNSTLGDVRKTVIKSLDYLSSGMEISINLYVMDIPGCHYQKEQNLIREYMQVPIELDGKEIARINKSEWLYPFDKDVRNLAKRVEEEHLDYEQFFKDRFGIQHIPGRIYTFIVFYEVLHFLGLDQEKERLLDIFKTYYAKDEQRHKDSAYSFSAL